MKLSVAGRQARQASVGWYVAKTLAQTVIFWTVFLFLIPTGVRYIEQRFLRGIHGFAGEGPREAGVSLFVVGGILGLTSGAVMAVRGHGTPLPTDCARRLVVAGPYRYIRNPMAVAGLLQGIAVGIYMGSYPVVIYALLGGPVWNFFVRPWEEADLLERFGVPYRRYRAAVGCWLPRFPGYMAMIDEGEAVDSVSI